MQSEAAHASGLAHPRRRFVHVLEFIVRAGAWNGDAPRNFALHLNVT
ncbi:MAG: hypothetical protein IT529_05365 [Burkholderiales bacterium]|nr:hypothetical protein [Burkholderiales bacterium]